MDDAKQEARQHQPQCRFRVDITPSDVVGRVALPDFWPKSAQVENMVNPGEDVIIEHQITKRSGEDQLGLTTRLAAQHVETACTVAEPS